MAYRTLICNMPRALTYYRARGAMSKGRADSARCARLHLGGGMSWGRPLASLPPAAEKYLGDGGMLALETGIDQHGKLRDLAAAAGFGRIESRRDLSGRDRHFLAWR